MSKVKDNFTIKLKKAFLQLLRQGLWNRNEGNTGHFPLTDEEWQKIYQMSVIQTTQGIIYDGIKHLAPEHRPPRNLLMRWTVVIDTLERMNRRQIQTQQLLHEIFGREPSIRYQILKGQTVSTHYPAPEHRYCGDIDLYFGNDEQTEKANRRIEELGIVVTRGRDGEASYMINNVEVEHHSHLLDLNNPLKGKKIKQWEEEKFNECKETKPSPIANHLLLSTHILKHWIDLGIGLRQLCDLAVTLKAQQAQTDTKELKKICKEFNIFNWNKLLYSLLNKHLGLEKEYLPFPCNINPDEMLDEIFESGNFGHGDTRYGERPEGKWKSKQHTLKIVSNKMHISLRYATSETLWWLTKLAYTRTKELFKH